MRSNDRVLRGLAVAMATGALAAPAASAAPVEQLVPHAKDSQRSSEPAPLRVVQVTTDDGFDWSDAGIGATGVLALVAIATGALVATRRRPGAGHTVA